MLQILDYYARFQGFRGRVGGLPGWGRFLLAIAAIPGIILVGLSLLALTVSILALLLLVVPVYRLLMLVTGAGRRQTWPVNEVAEDMDDAAAPPPSGRRQVEVRILESPPANRHAEG